MVARAGGDGSAAAHLVEREVLGVVQLFDGEAASIARLIRRYRNVPMSLADACLVRLVELTPEATVFTIKSDFAIYRQKGRRVIPLLAP